MMGKHHAEREQEAAYAQEPAPYQQPAPYQPQPAAPAPPPQRGITSDDTARLQELGRLHEQGILTDEEFSRQKAVILGTG